MKQVIVFSHGFGVRFGYKDLLPDIVKAFSGVLCITFEYNDFDERTNSLTVSPLDKQAELLKQKVTEARTAYPNARIDLICHSQGCLVAAMAGLDNLNKVIFLAPPVDSAKSSIKMLFERPGAQYDPKSMSILPRRDGSITKIPAAYWDSQSAIESINDHYQSFAKKNNLIIVTATEDEVLGDTDLSMLENATIHDISADHNFTGLARQKLITYLGKVL